MPASDSQERSESVFQMLTKNAQTNLRILEYAIICLMSLIAILSTIWTLSLHVLFVTFYNGFADVTLVFGERDFADLTDVERTILQNDIEKIHQVYEHYTGILNGEATFRLNPINEIKDSNKTNSTEVVTANFDEILNGNDTDLFHGGHQYENLTITQLQLMQDYYFLSHMEISIQESEWQSSLAAYFIHNLPYLSEIIAIMWMVLSFICQYNLKSGPPKPWLIVLPSILMFSLMAMASLIYTILANIYIKRVCRKIKSNLQQSHFISCGKAITLLRPVILSHNFTLNTYLMMYRYSYTITLILWSCALIILVSRFLLAMDFPLSETMETIPPNTIENDAIKSQECLEVSVNAPSTTNNASKETTKFDEDFQSAKSFVSDATIPLLDEFVVIKTK